MEQDKIDLLKDWIISKKKEEVSIANETSHYFHYKYHYGKIMAYKDVLKWIEENNTTDNITKGLESLDANSKPNNDTEKLLTEAYQLITQLVYVLRMTGNMQDMNIYEEMYGLIDKLKTHIQTKGK